MSFSGSLDQLKYVMRHCVGVVLAKEAPEYPYQAQIDVQLGEATTGWNAPELAPWLEKTLNQISETYFGAPALYMGEGGTIPFMNMLGERFPQAQFVITGVLGPQSNAHGPNEFLHIPYAKRLTASIAHLLFSQSTL